MITVEGLARYRKGRKERWLCSLVVDRLATHYNSPLLEIESDGHIFIFGTVWTLPIIFIGGGNEGDILALDRETLRGLRDPLDIFWCYCKTVERRPSA